MKNIFRYHMGRWVCLGLLLCWSVGLQAQDEKELAPVTRTYAITHVNIIQAPGRKVDLGTVVVKDGLIIAVGKDVAIPAEAIIIKADSMYVYAGFIDGLSRAGVPKPKDEPRERIKDPGNPAPEKAGINPQVDVRTFLNPEDNSVKELRNLGFTTAQVVPYGNLLSGQAAIVLLGGKSADDMVIASHTALYSELTGGGGVYPSTVIGVMAKWRELYRQAELAKSYRALYLANRAGLTRPEENHILEAFFPVIDQKLPVLFNAPNILDVQRVYTLRSDLKFPLILADVKNAWPMVKKIKAAGTNVFLSLDLPEVKKEAKDSTADKKGGKDEAKKEVKPAAKAKTPADVEKEALEKRKAEAIANYDGEASTFQKAGITFGFSTISAKAKDIPANLRRIIAAGLSEDAALAALTTSPAQILGLSDRLGTVDVGKMANLVVTDKSYFNEKAKVRYVFVDGVLHTMEIKEPKKADAKVAASGNWSYTSETPQGASAGKLVIKEEGGVYSGTITSSFAPGQVIPLTTVALDGKSLTFAFPFDAGGDTISVEVTVNVEGDTFDGNITAGQFGTFPVKGTRDPKN